MKAVNVGIFRCCRNGRFFRWCGSNCRGSSRRRLGWDAMIVMSKTVIHADDSASVRLWVAEQLGDMDLKVISVADGEAALQVLRESPCDLLLTDLEMPNLDGLSLVAAVRDLPMHRFMPALVLSCRQPS